MLNLLWTFPVLMAASIAIGWAAEITAVHLSAGIALAVLAWLQCAPEFAVEASIAWSQNTHLALANLTGSLRLLMGLGWPVVFLIFWVTSRRNGKSPKIIRLERSFCVEAAGLTIPLIYFSFIVAKGTWTGWDGIVLCSFYGFYFWLLNRARRVEGLFKDQDAAGEGALPLASEEHAQEHDDSEPWVVRKVLALRNHKLEKLAAFGIFALGGVVLYFVVHPFIESLKVAALTLGVSEFVFIQWVAPVASEFPEKVTAFNWARKSGKASMAIVNMLSSVTSQWTLLAGLVPLVFSLSAGHMVSIELSPFQRTELMLTIAQSACAVIFLSDLKIRDYEAVGLFSLWLAQFLMPDSRGPLVVVYSIWFLSEVLRLKLTGQRVEAWFALKRVIAGR